MPAKGSNGMPWKIIGSELVLRSIRALQRWAAREGWGGEMLRVLREIRDRLLSDPKEFGEPLYHLDALSLEIRTASVRPLIIEFGVHETRPLVFIQEVKLLPKSRPT
jgi:hypothetical protein